MPQNDRERVQGLEAALAQMPSSSSEVLAELLELHVERGAWDAVFDTAKRMLAEEPRHETALRRAIKAATALNLLKEAIAFVDRLLEIYPDDVHTWHKGAFFASQIGDPSAYRRAERCCQLDPGNPLHENLRRTIAAKAVPIWHFTMMNDVPRNSAYAEGIARHVKDKLVLEIGTGAGLLALLAARSGAQRVITCEANVLLAETAREIVAANGLSHIITVVPKMSTDLVVGVDLPEKADILVAEIFASLLVGEGVLASLNDARTRLLKPGARAIPGAVACCGALAAGRGLENLLRVDKVHGFDMTAMNKFAGSSIALKAPVTDLAWLSKPADLFGFDLNSVTFALKGRTRVEVTTTTAGRAAGVVAWMRLDFDEQTAFENRPSSVSSPGHWAPHFFAFAQPLDLVPGQVVAFDCIYTNRAVLVDLSGATLSNPARN